MSSLSRERSGGVLGVRMEIGVGEEERETHVRRCIFLGRLLVGSIRCAGISLLPLRLRRR